MKSAFILFRYIYIYIFLLLDSFCNNFSEEVSSGNETRQLRFN